jgi:hypothetical protein
MSRRLRWASGRLWIALALWTAVDSPADQETWLDYEPTVVTLSGKVIERHEFGPPYYGEHPEIDDKLVIQILQLPSPISVRADPSDDLNTEETGLREIQLAFPSGLHHDHLSGKCVAARGTLYHATSGYHFTNVLLWVSEANEIDCP